MITSTNIAFTLLIKVQGRLREFNFRKRLDNYYDTNTNDEYSIRYFFRMEKNEGGWHIAGKDLPGWITENESAISLALEQKEKES